MHLPVLTRIEQVRRAILQQILSGNLRPGERLLEAKLSKELGVSPAWSSEAQACLQEQVDQMRRAARTKDLAKWGIADYTFHQEIYRLSGNPYLMQASQAIAAGPFAYILCDHLEAL